MITLRENKGKNRPSLTVQNPGAWKRYIVIILPRYNNNYIVQYTAYASAKFI